MDSSQDIAQNDATFSSLPSYAQYENNEEPSFLNTQLPLFGDAGILNQSAGETIAELTKVWMDERHAPELLPYEHSLVEPLILAIESQVNIYLTLTVM
jgi:GINS complex subunit 4